MVFKVKRRAKATFSRGFETISPRSRHEPNFLATLGAARTTRKEVRYGVRQKGTFTAHPIPHI